MARDVAAGSHVGAPGAPGVVKGMEVPNPGGVPGTTLQEHAYQQAFMHYNCNFYEKVNLQIKMQHQIQQQKLLQDYQIHQQQLAEKHQAELKQHLKELWEQQKALEDQTRERREQERLEALRRKDKQEHSANASTEVKQKLQTFLMRKREQAATNGTSPGSSYRNWGVVKSSSGESLPLGASGSHPYRISPSQQHPHTHPQVIGKYDSDFPLRKTASEPNLLKVRLKQRVIDRRASPMGSRRHERLLANFKRKGIPNCSVSSNPDSGPNSPPALTSRGSPTNAPIQEENEEQSYGGLVSGSQQGSLSDLSLFSSPSMPNISLGRPHIPNPAHTATESQMLQTVSEAKVRAAFTARLGVSLTGQMLPGTLPYYPTLPVIESEYSTVQLSHKQMQALEQRAGNVSSMYAPITDTQVAHHHLNKAGHRPLGRTQSAPLPLGHPMLTGAAPLSLAPTHYEEYTQAEKQALGHNMLKQHIRQTVLTRVAGGRQEPPIVTHIPPDGAEVIDLTDKKIPKIDETDVIKQQRDREALQQKRDLMMRHSLQVSEENAYARPGHSARPLSRALSSPLVHLGPPLQTPVEVETPPVNLSVPRKKATGSPHKITTGLAFDSLMLKHACRCGDNSVHPEHGGRLQSVWARLIETGLVSRCDRVRSRKATLEEIQTCHSETHTLLFGTNPLHRQKLDMAKLSQLPVKSFVRLQCGGVGVDSDTTWNEIHTGPAARMAAGCVIDLAFKTAMGDIRNGFAVVRPPGHHAEPEQAMGFCFFNSVAIAATLLKQRLNMQKILIVDWDVHHGNGTQQMFYDDKRVLYLSIHRHDDGNFFPGTGGPTECGIGEGVGFNVNVAWSGGLNPPLGDAEYLAAFRTIVMPIAREFAPDLILVSAGFDAAHGHPPPLGGYTVTPACFGQMTKELLTVANGKVVLSLEGGYDLPAICDSAQECVRALLGDECARISETELTRPPCQNAIDTLQKTIAIQLAHWSCVKRSAHTVGLSAIEASRKEMEETDTVTAMAGLSMQPLVSHTPDRSREVSEEPMDQDEGK